MMGFYGWNLSMSQIIVSLPVSVPVPTVLQRRNHPRRDESVGLGVRQHRKRAVLLPATPTTRSPVIAPSIIRLDGLLTANEEGRALPEITTTPCKDGTVQLEAIEVRTPDGKQLVNPLDLRLEVGDTLVVNGESGSGKTTLLRSLAELWPFTTGTLTRPCGPNETMFLSQMPYVPLGDLRAVVTTRSRKATSTTRR